MGRQVMMIVLGIGLTGALLVAVITTVFLYRCPAPPKLEWWKTTILYHTITASYRDSDGDGTGDLRGLIENLDYLNGDEDSLGVDSVMLNPMYLSGGHHNYYDAIDFFDIEPFFGTLEDFEDFSAALHRKGMKQVFPFLPNHSSNKHPWFLKSVAKEGKYTDYYVWAPGKNGGPPNNWQALRGGPAWTFVPERGEYYLHQFSALRADLNARSPDMQEEFEKILTFWLDKGVDGFNAEGVAQLFECADLADEAVLDPTQPLSYKNLNHTCTIYQPESFEIVTKWRKLMDDYAEANDKELFLLVNSDGNNAENINFYEYKGQKGAHMTMNKNFLGGLRAGCDATCVSGLINNFIQLTKPEGYWNNWRIGKAHASRVLSRMDDDRRLINALNLMLLTLPGSPSPYYGEEIGMHDLAEEDLGENNEEYAVLQTPLQWSAEAFAGFTEGDSTWVPIPADYVMDNIERQKGSDGSHLELYRKYIKLREAPSMKWGEFNMAVVGNILFYVRKAEGYPGYLIAMNFGPGSTTVDFTSNAPDDSNIPDEGVVVANTGNFAASKFNVGRKVDLKDVSLDLGQGVVIRLEKNENCWTRRVYYDYFYY